MNTYLQHHGIKGQKWGVRNGPPYPLGSGQKTSAEKKQSGSSTLSGKQATEKALKNLSGCDPATITLLAYLGVSVVSYIATMSAVDKAAKNAVKKMRKDYSDELEQRYKDSKIQKVSDVPKTLKDTTPEESMKVTNPGFPDAGRTMNCTFCTAAMAMREKSYDVQAKASEHGWFTDDLYKKTFNAEHVKLKSRNAQQTLDTLAAMGDGAYGHLGVSWKLGGSHSLFWKNEGGKTRIYDGQSGQEFDIKNGEYARYINHKNTDYTRLDNCEPTDYVMAMVEPRSKGE